MARTVSPFGDDDRHHTTANDAVSRRLTDNGLPTRQVDATTDARRQSAEHGRHVTPEGAVGRTPQPRRPNPNSRPDGRPGARRTARDLARSGGQWAERTSARPPDAGRTDTESGSATDDTEGRNRPGLSRADGPPKNRRSERRTADDAPGATPPPGVRLASNLRDPAGRTRQDAPRCRQNRREGEMRTPERKSRSSRR